MAIAQFCADVRTGAFPVDRGDVPHDRSHGRGPRSVRREDDTAEPELTQSHVGVVTGAGRGRGDGRSAVGDRDRCARAAMALRRCGAECPPRSHGVGRRRAVLRLPRGAGRDRRPLPHVVVADTSAAAARSASRRSWYKYAGMSLRLPARATRARIAFTMEGVSDPLDITWFTADGSRISAAPHAPVPPHGNRSECPLYRGPHACRTRARGAGRPPVADGTRALLMVGFVLGAPSARLGQLEVHAVHGCASRPSPSRLTQVRMRAMVTVSRCV